MPPPEAVFRAVQSPPQPRLAAAPPETTLAVSELEIRLKQDGASFPKISHYREQRSMLMPSSNERIARIIIGKRNIY